MQDAFLDVTLPVLGATLRALDAEHRQARCPWPFGTWPFGCTLGQQVPGWHAVQTSYKLGAGSATISQTRLVPPAQVVGEEDRKLQKRLKYLGERMSRRGAQEEGELLLALDLWQAVLSGRI